MEFQHDREPPVHTVNKSVLFFISVRVGVPRFGERTVVFSSNRLLIYVDFCSTPWRMSLARVFGFAGR